MTAARRNGDIRWHLMWYLSAARCTVIACSVWLMPEGISMLQPFSLKESIERCQEEWGVTPRPMWATIEWGGKRIESASNIVFSNGLYDPW